MKTRTVLRSAIASLCLALSASCLHAATAVVSDDAFTMEATPKLKRGTLPTICVSSKQVGFVRFDLSALPANLPREQIAKATLRLWTSRVIHPGTASVFPVDGEWDELTITHNNAPAISATTAGSIALAAKRKAFYGSLEVTELVRDWMTGVRENRGIALKSDGTSSAVFDSKENMATSHEPTLEIVLAGPEGRQGIQGIAGMNGANGTNGLNGMQGLAGIDGTNGKDGINGQAGAQGPAGPIVAGSVLMRDSDAAVAGYTYFGNLPQWVERQKLETSATDNSFSDPAVALAPDGLHFVGASTAGNGYPHNHFVHDISAGTWSRKPDLVGIGEAAVAVSHNGDLFVFGGVIGNQYQNLAQRYSVADGSWTPLAPLPTPRAYAGAAVLGNRIIVLGGSMGDGVGGAAATVESYDPVTNSWQTLTPLPAVGALPVCGVVNGELYVSGLQGGANAYKRLFKYNASNPGWSELTPAPELALGHGAVINGQLYLRNGLGHLLVFNPVSGTWSFPPNVDPAPSISTYSVTAVGEKLFFLYPGSNQSGQFSLFEGYLRPRHLFSRD